MLLGFATFSMATFAAESNKTDEKTQKKDVWCESKKYNNICCPDGKTEILHSVTTTRYLCSDPTYITNITTWYSDETCPKSSSLGTLQSELVFDEP